MDNIYCLLTSCETLTVESESRNFELWTELVRSVRINWGFSILRYGTSNLGINSIF